LDIILRIVGFCSRDAFLIAPQNSTNHEIWMVQALRLDKEQFITGALGWD
jgi:hypothetical protein